MSFLDFFYTLAPTELPTHRRDRYDGGGFNTTLRDFAPEDAALILRLYGTVKRVYDLWLYMRDDPNLDLMQKVMTEELGTLSFIKSVQSIGAATYSLAPPSELTRKIMHDIRGGALTTLVGCVQYFELADDRDTMLKRAVLLARDHAKLMRNAISDIDPTVAMADESIKIHPISDFVDKWADSTFRLGQKEVKVMVDSHFHGDITNRCLETSAIDRILYNYINNAGRFTADNRVTLTLLPVGDKLVRWVVGNRLSADQETWLAENVGRNLEPLFRGGITRGGHGIGLSGCVDFVAASFGLERDEALEEGYLGAKVVDGMYYAWFHWPSYQATDSNEARCTCSD